jgi:hypothetical protein
VKPVSEETHGDGVGFPALIPQLRHLRGELRLVDFRADERICEVLPLGFSGVVTAFFSLLPLGFRDPVDQFDEAMSDRAVRDARKRGQQAERALVRQ